MTAERLFGINLRDYEPHTVRTGKGHKDVKEELRQAILRDVGAKRIEEAKLKIRDQPIRILVEFRLWKGSASTSNTRSRKDLDNLLKPVLDVLQTSLDAKQTKPGLGLIGNDDLVHNIEARKHIVNRKTDEGIEITISESD